MFPSEVDIKKISELLDQELDFSDLKPIACSGLTHEHIIIDNSDYILRVPRKNQLAMEPLQYLEQQKFCYDVASASGVTPSCKGIIPPSEELPNGALVVTRIDGRAVNSAEYLPAIAKCLAAMSEISPVKSDLIEVVDKPFATIEGVNDFFFDTYLDKMDDEVAEPIKKLRAKTKSKLDFVRASGKGFPIGMIGGDSHLGNYMIDKQGKAWFVDLEFLAFDVPALDAADAISDLTKQLVPENSKFEVTKEDKENFYKTYFDNIDNAEELKLYKDLAEDMVTLRTIGWMCYWKAEGQYDPNRPPQNICDNYDALCNKTLTPNALNAMLGSVDNTKQVRSNNINAGL